MSETEHIPPEAREPQISGPEQSITALTPTYPEAAPAHASSDETIQDTEPISPGTYFFTPVGGETAPLRLPPNPTIGDFKRAIKEVDPSIDIDNLDLSTFPRLRPNENGERSGGYLQGFLSGLGTGLKRGVRRIQNEGITGAATSILNELTPRQV